MTPGGKRVFSHEEAFPELGALALGALSAVEVDAVIEHVANCSICKAELAVMYDTVAGFASADAEPQPQKMSASRSLELRADLVERARQDAVTRGANATSATPSLPPDRGRAVPPILVQRRIFFAPIATALAASIVIAVLAVQQGQKTKDLQQASSALSARVDSLESELAKRNRMLVALAGKEVRVVELTSAGITSPRARMFWDIATDSWTMFAHDLPQLAAGRTYQLWLITASLKKISAGTFSPSPTGEAVVQANYDLGAETLQMIAITEEPSPGVPQPTGTPIIAGGAK